MSKEKRRGNREMKKPKAAPKAAPLATAATTRIAGAPQAPARKG